MISQIGFAFSYHKTECRIDLDSIDSEVTKCLKGATGIKDAIVYARPKVKREGKKLYFNQAQLRGKSYNKKIASNLKSYTDSISSEVIPKYKGKDTASLILYSYKEARKNAPNSMLFTSLGASTSKNVVSKSYTSTGFHYFENLNQNLTTGFSLRSLANDKLKDIKGAHLYFGTVFNFKSSSAAIGALIGIASTEEESTADPGLSANYFYDLENFLIGLNLASTKTFSEASAGIGMRY